MSDEKNPQWLGRAWRLRAVVITAILALLAMAYLGQPSAPEGPIGPLVAALVIVLALWGDWVWLRRNHHRLNDWGLSKGRDFRKKPK